MLNFSAGREAVDQRRVAMRETRLALARWTLLAGSAIAMPALGAHVGDFDGDGKDDVLLWNQGSWHVHELNGLTAVGGETEAPGLPRDTDWQVAGVGDLNRDGNDDVLFRHRTGVWFYHAMNGRQTMPSASGTPALPESLAWQLAGIGDLNRDGSDDVLLRHRHGRWLYFAMDGLHRVAAGRGVALPRDLRLRFAGIGDLNGDGNDDILLRHVDGRWFYYAILNGRALTATSGEVALLQHTDHRIPGIGDLNGDGNDDILLRNSNGRWLYYAMNGRHVLAEQSGRADISSSQRWQLAGVGDLNGDGLDDVLLQNTDGRWFYYAMNGRRPVAAQTGHPGLPRTGAIRACDDGDRPSYVGYVAGYAGTTGQLEAVLTSPTTLQVAQPDRLGCFAFYNVPPGRYAIKINAEGHRSTPARIRTFPFSTVHDGEPYAVQQLATDPFTYHWEEDQTTPAGAEYSSHIVQPRIVEFQGSTLDVSDAAAAEHLEHDYNVLLVGAGWSQEHAFRLLTTMEAIPQPLQLKDPGGDFLGLPASAWRLTDDFIDGDVVIDTADDGTREVTISSAAFVNAAPRIATVDGKRGVWFSRRLHHAAVRFVTDNGHDRSAYERIFKERYGVTTHIDDYPSLTAPTGNESRYNFQAFHADEILLLINMLEEMPVGMHKLDGMRYLVRRLNGLPHPLYPGAPAVAWPESEYVEFMEKAFKDQSEDYMHRLIIHEKAHFLWTHVFRDQLKADWIEIGGWYEDPAADSGWSTTKSAEFVSAYAHRKNPNEDMAETISYFIVNPDRLRARSMAKYEFVRDRIMQGDIYVARIREDLTFEVYNLFPDYVYPGKIKSIDITVEGGSLEAKRLTVEVELHALDLEKEGAHRGQTRIRSEVGTFFDLWLYPVDEGLRGTTTISKYAKAGYWLSHGIRLDDVAGNSRYSSRSDFGWRMYVDNALEDIDPPEYVPHSLTINKSLWEKDDTVQVIRVGWTVEEIGSLRRCSAVILAALSDTYSYDRQGSYDDDDDICTVDFLMPSYMPSSTYSTVRVYMWDEAGNYGQARFTGDGATEPP